MIWNISVSTEMHWTRFAGFLCMHQTETVSIGICEFFHNCSIHYGLILMHCSHVQCLWTAPCWHQITGGPEANPCLVSPWYIDSPCSSSFLEEDDKWLGVVASPALPNSQEEHTLQQWFFGLPWSRIIISSKRGRVGWHHSTSSTSALLPVPPCHTPSAWNHCI